MPLLRIRHFGALVQLFLVSVVVQLLTPAPCHLLSKLRQPLLLPMASTSTPKTMVPERQD